MSIVTLVFTLGFVVVAMGISMWQKLGLQKDLLIAVIRSTVQLLLVGYVLKMIFDMKSPVYTILMLGLMVVVAALNAKKRGAWITGIFWRLTVAIALTAVVSLSFMLAVGIIPFTPQYVITLGGLMIGNAMVISSLFLNRLKSEVRGRRHEINVLLSLGATPKQAVRYALKTATKSSMIPTIDTMKTTGLVQLPGIMTGQIIAGASPVQAVRYQILILFALLSAAAVTSITLGLLTYPSLFNTHQQLNVPDDIV
jgi:putative ABC transport system permease protein